MGLQIISGPEWPQDERKCDDCGSLIYRETGSMAIGGGKRVWWCDCGWQKEIVEDFHVLGYSGAHDRSIRPIDHMCDPPEIATFFPNITSAKTGPLVD
jgi:hypothetical protein